MTTTGLTADPRDAALAEAKALIAELHEENEAFAALVIELMVILNELMEPGQPERVH